MEKKKKKKKRREKKNTLYSVYSMRQIRLNAKPLSYQSFALLLPHFYAYAVTPGDGTSYSKSYVTLYIYSSLLLGDCVDVFNLLWRPLYRL